MPRALLALLLAGMLAGCSSSDGQSKEPVPGEIVVEGWILDAALAPVPATILVQGSSLNATTDEGGHYLIQAPTDLDLLVIVQAVGFHAQSRFVPAGSGTHAWVNVTLERIPFAQPYHLTTSFRGTLQCAVTAVVGEEDPDNPHEHQSVQCSDVVSAANATWNYTIPAGVTALILEAFWEPSTPAATALIVKAVIPETGEILSLVEGINPLHQQLSEANIARNLAAGHDLLSIQVKPGAGTGGHDHGAVGVFMQQQFELFMTEFYNGPADPTFTIDG